MSDEGTKPEEGAQETGAAASSGARRAPATFRCVIGEKKGMTQIYDRDGKLWGVTVVEAGPCLVSGVRTSERDAYAAVQIAFGSRKEKNLGRPLVGHFKKLGLAPAKWLREFRVKDMAGFETGQVVDLASRFKAGDYVDVRGTSKGKGFAGVMKRHNFHGMPGSHGASDKERSPGSLAARRALGRVLPGQRMAGHLGHEATTVQKIEVIDIDLDKHLLFLNGSVPGPNGGLVCVTETTKNRKHKIVRKAAAVLRDKMGNIIKAKGAKAAAVAQAKPAAGGDAKKK